MDGGHVFGTGHLDNCVVLASLVPGPSSVRWFCRPFCGPVVRPAFDGPAVPRRNFCDDLTCERLQKMRSLSRPLQVWRRSRTFDGGSKLDLQLTVGVKTVEELQAYQVARALKLEVYRLVDEHPGAAGDFRFRDQLRDAAASGEMNVAEGFRRYSAADFSRFLKIARSSVDETSRWVQDGVDRRHYSVAEAQRALDLADRAGRLITGLIISLRPFITGGTNPSGKTKR